MVCILGGPVLVIPWGKIAARKIYKTLGEDEIIKSVIRLIETRPSPSVQFSTLIDCEDVCLRQVNQFLSLVRFKVDFKRYFRVGHRSLF